VQRNSFGESCAYRLDQNTLEIQAGQQFLEGSPLAGFTGVIKLLHYGDAKPTGGNRDLGEKSVTDVIGLDGRAPPSLAVTDQLIQILCAIGDLSDYPGLQNLAVAHGFCEAVLLLVGVAPLRVV
jgi:hypothetical protein